MMIRNRKTIPGLTNSSSFYTNHHFIATPSDFFVFKCGVNHAAVSGSSSVNTLPRPWGDLLKISGSPAVSRAKEIKCSFLTKLRPKAYRIRGLRSLIIKKGTLFPPSMIKITSFYRLGKFSLEIRNINEVYLNPEVSMYTFLLPPSVLESRHSVTSLLFCFSCWRH